MTVTAGAAIRGRYVANAGERAVAQALMTQLQYDDLWRGSGTVRNDRAGGMRIDMQGTTTATPTTPVQHNLQVQKNGVSGNSTVAHANVSVTLQTTDPMNQRGVVNKVISALNQSMDTGHSYTVTGSIP
jgi:hypothetical protein